MGKGWPVWPARPAWPAFGAWKGLAVRFPRGARGSAHSRQQGSPPLRTLRTPRLPRPSLLKPACPGPPKGERRIFVIGLSSSGVCVLVPTVFISCRSFPHRRLLSRYLLYRILIPTVAPAQRSTYPTCIPALQILRACTAQAPFARRTHFGPATALSVRFTTHRSNSRTRGGALAATGTPCPCPSRGRVPSGTTI
jgi:hypothetical protein